MAPPVLFWSSPLVPLAGPTSLSWLGFAEAGSKLCSQVIALLLIAQQATKAALRALAYHPKGPTSNSASGFPSVSPHHPLAALFCGLTSLSPLDCGGGAGEAARRPHTTELRLRLHSSPDARRLILRPPPPVGGGAHDSDLDEGAGAASRRPDTLASLAPFGPLFNHRSAARLERPYQPDAPLPPPRLSGPAPHAGPAPEGAPSWAVWRHNLGRGP